MPNDYRDCPLYQANWEHSRALCRFFLMIVLITLCCGSFGVRAAFADADEMVSSPSEGMQPLTGAVPTATPYPGESKTLPRADGTVQAIPEVHGRTKVFHLVARSAPWTLKPGLTVMAKTYNGVVPGPTLLLQQGDRVVIEYRNELDIPDTIHLHGIHGIPVSMDGVPGSSQPMIPPHGTYRYVFQASQPGTFIYHTHDREAVLNSGLYGGIIVQPTHPHAEERAARDYLEMISAWSIRSAGESDFTLNGKEYPATKTLDVRPGERIRIRWINISAENWHTMHTHGHYMRVIARDAMPVSTPDMEDTISLGPGQRADVTVLADQKPGTWMIHCHVLDHTEDGGGMPTGLITSLHYLGTPDRTTAMYDEMMHSMMPPSGSPPQGGRLSLSITALLGAFAGLTIFLGLPVARIQGLRADRINLLNAVAIGILAYLVIEIAGGAVNPISRGVTTWRNGAAPFPVLESLALSGGLLAGLAGLGFLSTSLIKHGKQHLSDRPLLLSLTIAIGIGAHNFAEWLAIGASAASGATAIAAGLIVGFALHNATEGFGVAAPLAGRVVPTWGQIALGGLLAGGPTFVGTIVGYTFSSPLLSIFFLALAVGALIFVIGELWSVLKKTGVTVAMTSSVTLGFILAFITELIVDMNGG